MGHGRRASFSFLCGRYGLLLLLAAAGPQARAQFQAPDPAELRMTADPKAPGAAAVYLDLQQTADDNRHGRTFYARIKVLTEKGKELGTVEVEYGGNVKVTAIHARTIHSDGTIIPLEGKPDELLTAKLGDVKYERKVFTLPSVEVGSILEYSYDVDYPENSYSSPRWEIQQPYFVHKAHYAFTPYHGFLTGSLNNTGGSIYNSRTGRTANRLIWTQILPPGMAVKTVGFGTLALDVTDIPATPREEFMPPLSSVLYKVDFYYEGGETAQQFWDEEAKQWSKDVDHFAESGGGIRDAVAALVTPADTDLVKAKKLYDAVQALDNTDYSRKKTESEMKELKIKEARRAEDTWKQKSGDSEEMAMLYLAMARTARLNAYAFKVVNRNRALFDNTYLSVEQFDDTLVDVVIGGQDNLIDPGQKMCTFNQLSWEHSLAGAMRQGPNGASFVTTPEQNYLANTTQRVGDLTVQANGNVSGSVTISMIGQEALRWRQSALRSDDAELKKEFDRELAGDLPIGLEGHVDHFMGLNTPDTNLVAIVKVAGSPGAATAKRLLLPGFLFASRGKEPFIAEEKRLEPVDMHYGEKIVEQVTYHLPAGTTVEGQPADATENWAGGARYIVRTKAAPGQIVVARQLERAFTQAKAEDYPALRGFYQKVATGDQQQLVLRAAANAPSAPAAPGVVDIVPAGKGQQ